MDRFAWLKGDFVSHTDLVRIIVITSLTLSSIFIASLSLFRHVDSIYIQLFYFPILYATYFYPKRGLYLAGACALVYEVIAYLYLFPDTMGLIVATGQAVLLVCLAAVVAYFTEKVNTSEARYRSIFETSLLGIVLFDQNSFKIRFTNAHLEKILGYTKEDLAGMTFSELFSLKDEQRRFFEHLGSSEDITNFETTLLTKNHEPSWVNLSWRRITDNLVSCSVIDINTRKRAEQAAEENYTQYEQVTESSPTGIIILRHREVVYTNPAFRSFSGYGKEDLIGKDFISLIHPEDQSRFSGFGVPGTTVLPAPDVTECRFLSKSGEVRLGALFFVQIQQRGGVTVLINLVDITEREKLKERISQDHDRRNDIISKVAHELRTPLQPIMEYLNLIIQDPKAYGVTDETRAILERCAKNVDRESQIINQMLELSVLDSGTIQLKYSVFPVREALKKIIDAGGYQVKADIAVEIPRNITFEADENKISVVIDSMLSNAVNYSKPPRKIRIAYQSSAEEKMHHLAIQDNGIGITDLQLDEIFEPFNLSNSGTISRKYPRVGLSLSIAKKYVQMHGGYISVDSVVNLGSTFTIHIPKQRPGGVP